MEMTESTARQKWCPLARSCGKDSDVAGNRERYGREGEIMHNTRCIASGCMAWVETETGQFVKHKDISGISYELRNPPGEPMGYCGALRGAK